MRWVPCHRLHSSYRSCRGARFAARPPHSAPGHHALHQQQPAQRSSSAAAGAASGAPSAMGAAPPPKVVVVTGPTGVGKTAVALLLAERLGGEVVSADSVQVYRGLDVGSDKLPVAQRRGVPHHLLDVCDVHEEYSAGCFHDQGRAAIRDILQRGRVPVVAGGTGFYLRLLIEGKPATNRTTPELEQAVEQRVQQAWADAAREAGLGSQDASSQLPPEAKWDAAVRLLGEAGDLEAMQRIGQERNNWYRLKRALAILMANPGRTLRDLDVPAASAPAPPAAQGQAEQQGSLSGAAADPAPAAVPQGDEALDFRTFFLHRPRAALYAKVERRLQEMVRALRGALC